MTWLLRIVLVAVLLVLVVRAIMRLFSGIVDGASIRQTPSAPGARMVKDPVCGTYVVQAQALTAVRGGETAFFCSPACRKAWQQR